VREEVRELDWGLVLDRRLHKTEAGQHIECGGKRVVGSRTRGVAL